MWISFKMRLILLHKTLCGSKILFYAESQREGNHTTKPLHAESWAVNNSWHRAARASATLQLALNYIIKRRGMFSSGLTRKQEEDRVGRGGWNCRPSVKIFLTITLLHLYWLSDKLLQFEKLGAEPDGFVWDDARLDLQRKYYQQKVIQSSMH